MKREAVPNVTYFELRQAGWSQSKIAHYVGVSRATTTRWEHGTRPHPVFVEKMKRIIDAKK